MTTPINLTQTELEQALRELYRSGSKMIFRGKVDGEWQDCEVLNLVVVTPSGEVTIPKIEFKARMGENGMEFDNIKATEAI